VKHKEERNGGQLSSIATLRVREIAARIVQPSEL
jgi:hypothetical protein